MKIINYITYFISSILFLKEYNFNEEKKREFKKRFSHFLAIWLLFIICFIFGLPNILGNIPENLGLQISFLLFIIFSAYHWFLLFYINRFAQKHIYYLVILLPMVFVFIWNLILWNKPTYFGAMDGFANIMTAQMQLTIVIIFPTFLFALKMVKIKQNLKGWLLLLITVISAILGIKQCIGKEGYLSDDTGNVFILLIILLISISFNLLKSKQKLNSEK